MNLARSAPAFSEFADDDIRDIVIRSYTGMGSISGIGQSTVSVEAREAIVPDRHLAHYSVRIDLSTGGDYPQEAAANIPCDDIDRLINMMRKLETTTISTDRFSFSEVQFEINDLRVIVFNTDSGSTMVSLAANGVSIHLSSLAKLSSVTALVERAKKHLDTHRRFQ